jgi:type I restriction enzyme, S subunit
MNSWVTTTIGSLATYVNGRGFKPAEWTTQGFPIVRIANLNNPTAGYDYFAGDLDEGHKIDTGDIVVSWSATLDTFIWNRGPAALNQHIFKVIPNKDVVDPDFLFFVLKQAMTGLSELVHGATMKHVTRPEFEEFEIRIPVRKDDQRRIATRLKAQLAAVEEARQAAQAQAKDVAALQSAIYREAFAEIVPVGVPPAFEDAPAGWRWEKLAPALARLESGHTPSRLRPDWWGGDVSWVSLTEIRAFDGRWTEETQLRTNEAGIANSAARVLPRGTVCFSRTASVGFVTIMAKPMATSQDFANWVCGDELDPEFLMHALIRARRELRALATGATHKTIYMPTLESFHLCLPPRPEQERIVKRLKAQLAAVEEARIAAQAQLEEIERLPARLLAQAFADH